MALRSGLYSGEKCFDPLPHVVLFILACQSRRPNDSLTAGGDPTAFHAGRAGLRVFLTGRRIGSAAGASGGGR